jgi:uncharacterized membrane protein
MKTLAIILVSAMLTLTTMAHHGLLGGNAAGARIGGGSVEATLSLFSCSCSCSKNCDGSCSGSYSGCSAGDAITCLADCCDGKQSDCNGLLQ